jgi:beta-lactamase regulating signal transducer with metallopeptidase domain/Leucine-rich repeat (LRR) protein
MFDALAQSAWISRIGWVLVHTLWQFAVIAAAALVLQRILQRRSAAVQYCALLVAMVAIVAAPVVTCFFVSPTEPPPAIAKSAPPATSQETPTMNHTGGSIPIENRAVPSPTPTAISQPPAAVDAAAPNVTSSWWAKQADRIRPWLPEIVLVWFAGVFLASMRPLLSWRTMRRLRCTGVSAVGEAIEVAVARIALRLKIARTVEVLQSALVQTPIVVGYIRPVILLPICVLSGLSPLQLESILAHELVHIRRHDYLVNLLQTLVETLFFYHPAVWWLSRQIRNERENCCDDVAMALSASRAEYGRALLAIEELRAAPTALSLAARGGSLLARIRRIAGHNAAPSFAATGSILGAVLASLVIFAAATWGAAPKAETPTTADDTVPKWNVAHRVVSGLSGGFMTQDSRNIERSRLLAILPGYELLGQKAVLAKLNLTAEQEAKMFELSTKYSADMMDHYRRARSKDASQDEQKRAYDQWLREEQEVTKNRVKEILGPEQVAVLGGLIAAEAAFNRLAVPEYRKNFDFTNEQSDRLRALDNEASNRNIQRFERTTERLLANLSPEQRIRMREVGLGPLSHGEYETISVSVEGLSDPLQVITLLPYPDLGDEKTQKQLQLTEEQREQVRKILAGSSNATEKLVREQLKLPLEELKRMRETPLRIPPGRASASNKREEPAAIRERVANERKERWAEFQKHPLVKMSIELRKQFEALLTPEQLAAYQDMAVHTVAAGVLYDAIVWEKMGASAEQQAALRQITEESLASFAQFKLEMGAKLLDVLTPAQQEKLQELGEKERPGDAKHADKSVPAEKNKSSEKPKTVRGKVLDDAGNPIAGADVWLPIEQQGVVEKRPVSHAKTDREGRFSFEIPGSWFDGVPVYRNDAVVWAYAPGRSINTASAYKILFKDDKNELEIKLGPESDLSFIVHSPDGKPLAGAAVSPYYFETQPGFIVVRDELLPLVSTKTDANGSASLPAIPRSKLMNVKIDSPEFGAQTVRLNPAETGAKSIQLRSAGRIEGQFIAAEPSHVSHVRIYLTTHDDSQPSDMYKGQDGVAHVTTDDQGRFVVPRMATGVVHFEMAVDEKMPVCPELPRAARVSADKTATLNIPMAPTVAVHGRVNVKGTGQPVPNAEIHLYYGVGRQGADPITGANGEYSARVLPGDVRQQVIYMPPEFVAVNVDMNKVIQVPADATNFELPLIEAERAKTISGQLTADDALKFTDFRVCVIDGKKYYGYGDSDEKGFFSIGQIPEPVDPDKVKYGLIRKKGSNQPELIGEVAQTDPLVVRVKKAEEPAAAPKQPVATAKPPSLPTQTIDVSGQVLDDETGKPVGQFVVQAGLVDKKDPTKITWGYSETRTTSENREGTFSQHIDWGAGWRARIIAAGYLPQPIFEKGVPPTATKIDHYIVRLKRGKQVTGRVLYHDGKPAADTAVFMIVKEGGGGVQIGDGKAWQSFGPERSEDPTVTRATTDAAGRFELPGGGRSAKAIAVSAPNVDLWVVPPPKPDTTDELTIKLPEPGRLIVKYDIDGSPAKAPLSLQMVTWETPPLDPSWKGIDNIHELTVPNKGDITIEHLPPGKYTLARIMPAEANHSVGRFFDDRREITVQSGKTAKVVYIRDRGTPVEGQITGLKEGMLAGIYPGAIVAVRPTKVTGPLESGASMEEPIFDIVVCGPDGKFKTPRLLPGEYAVIAEAFEAEKPENRAMSGIRAPTFVGRTTVTVPEAGPPPTVTIEIRRRDEAPPAKPSEKTEEKPKPSAETQTTIYPSYNNAGYGNYPSAAAPAADPQWRYIQLPNGRFRLLSFDGVVRALNISDEQVSQIYKLQTARLRGDDVFVKAPGYFGREDQSKVWRDREAEGEKKIEKRVQEILSPEQLQTLDEINSRDERITKLGGRVSYDTASPGAFHISFQGSKIDDAGLDALRGMANLVDLNLGGTNITDDGAKALEGLKNLKTLHIWDTKITDAGLQSLKNLTQLSDLALGGLSITDAGLEHLKRLTELKCLYLTLTKVTDAGMEHIKGLTELRILSLTSTGIADAGIEKLKGLTKLEMLHFNHTNVTGAGLGNFPALALLDLSDSPVNDAGLAHLKGLHKLSVLGLSNTKITDAGLEHLKSLSGFTTPRAENDESDCGLLLLNKTKITDAGLKHLDALKGLRGVDLTGTKVTAAGVEQLQKALPQCKIEWKPPQIAEKQNESAGLSPHA